MPVGKKKKAQAEESTNVSKLQSLCNELNKAMAGHGRIDVGADILWIDPPRLPSGILGLDYISAGGLPRGGLVQFWGGFSSSKTTTAQIVAGNVQRRGENVLLAMAETFSKAWSRRNGLFLPYSTAEIKLVNDAAQYANVEAMELYNEGGAGYGEAALLQHPHGDGLLEAVYRCVRRNVFSFVLVDSIAVLKNQRQLEDQEVGDEERGGGGQLQMHNRFVAKLMSALNTRYNDNGEPDMNGRHGNRTCVVCINQARQDQAPAMPGRGYSGPRLKPAGGEGAKHGWHLSVQFRRGEQIGDYEAIDGGKMWKVGAFEINAKGDKSKIGPPERSASWRLQVEDVDDAGTPAGAVNRAAEVRVWSTYFEILEQTGSWYVLNGERLANGKDAMDKLLREDADLSSRLYEACLERMRSA